MAAFKMVSENYVDAAWRDKNLRAQFETETGREPSACKERPLEEQLALGYYTEYRCAFIDWLGR